MTTILFPSPVTTFVIDPAERAIFVGTESSIIYQFNLFQSVAGKIQAVGGDPSHPVTADSAQDYPGHTTPITAIALSFDATLLVSGDTSGDIFIWDIGSRQVLRKIKEHKGISLHLYNPPPLWTATNIGPISSVVIFLKPEDTTPIGELQQFKRVQNERGRSDHDIWLTIPNQEPHVVVDDAEIARNGLRALTDEGSESKLKSRVLELEDEVARVYGAYGELKGVHEKLWKRYVDEKMQES
jgi:pre-rRNA-processing protein IPI3